MLLRSWILLLAGWPSPSLNISADKPTPLPNVAATSLCVCVPDGFMCVTVTQNLDFCKTDYSIEMVNTSVTSSQQKDTINALDSMAKSLHDQLMLKGCAWESCKGYACALFFPFCFADTAYDFQPCRETCNECMSTCDSQEARTVCNNLPSRRAQACTSSSFSIRQNLGWFQVLTAFAVFVFLFCSWF